LAIIIFGILGGILGNYFFKGNGDFGIIIFVLLGIIIGFIIGLLTNIIFGGFIATIINIDKNIEKITNGDINVKEKDDFKEITKNDKIHEIVMAFQKPKVNSEGKKVAVNESDWICPKCQTENPNSIYKCIKCGYSVI